ncbi:MAG TPA: pyridoxal phosphate-dependent aminotransferase [Vicinamibacteria bacterium]|nr:pyridoxal phosphate-dependent aminotransferase [Vicinamibacteria bacterium]
MGPTISERGRQMPASPIRKLMPLAEEAKRRGVRVLHLNIGQPDLPTPAAMRDRLREVPEILAYTPSGGTPEYIATLQQYYGRMGIELEAGQLMATVGGSEAVQFALFACANEGEEALLVEPFYTNYQAFATMAGVSLRPVPTRGEDGFHLPPRAVWEEHLTPRTKLVMLCNPNNPTGTVYTRDELTMVAEFCRDHGLFLVLDEVYRELVYDGRKPFCGLRLSGFDAQIVVVDSFSKRYSACGIRLGSLASRNPELMSACLRMGQGRLSAPGLAQLMAVGVRALGPEYSAEVTAEYQKRRDVLYRGLTKIPGLFLRMPEGAFYFVARLPVDDAEAFTRFMLAEFSHEGHTVMVSPAAGFYATPGRGTDEVRIAYVLKCEDLERAVAVLAHGIAAYRAAKA